MKISDRISSVLFTSLLAVFILGLGCLHAADQDQCPPAFPYHYEDAKQGFALCLPAGLKKGDAESYPPGSVQWEGFPTPKGTNLVSKNLIIVTGTDPNLEGATPDGKFKAGSATFDRFRLEDGSAGHVTYYLIYAWKHGGKTLHFDFALRAVNPGNFDPSNRPKEFDLKEQVKLSEQILMTFRATP